VRKDGDQLRVTAQLVRADDGTHLWSKTYARELRDVFTLQDDIARDVAQALSVKLDAVKLNTAQGGTTNVDAYDRYLRWSSCSFPSTTTRSTTASACDWHARPWRWTPRSCWLDALAWSLSALASDVDDVQAERLREEAAQVRARIAGLAPDHWIVKRERAYALWREASGRRPSP